MFVWLNTILDLKASGTQTLKHFLPAKLSTPLTSTSELQLNYFPFQEVDAAWKEWNMGGWYRSTSFSGNKLIWGDEESDQPKVSAPLSCSALLSATGGHQSMYGWSSLAVSSGKTWNDKINPAALFILLIELNIWNSSFLAGNRHGKRGCHSEALLTNPSWGCR